MSVRDFKFILERENSHQRIKLLCLNPAYTFRKLEEFLPHTVILTSGTLAPLHIYETEMQASFPLKYQGKHVIQSDQVFFAITDKICECEVNLSYEHRGNLDQQGLVGHYLLECFSVAPQGAIVFFSSYKQMYEMVRLWRDSGLLAKMRGQKDIFTETRNGVEMIASLRAYSVSAQKSAAFFCVAGGKLSEGFDFYDYMARLVVVIGVPFPNILDPKV